MSEKLWYELSEELSDAEKVDYLRRVFGKEAPFDPLHNLADAWSLTENKIFTNVELARDGSSYNCFVIADDARFDEWYAGTPQEAIIATVMKAYEAGVRQ